MPNGATVVANYLPGYPLLLVPVDLAVRRDRSGLPGCFPAVLVGSSLPLVVGLDGAGAA
jgi:hypothetical protein